MHAAFAFAALLLASPLASYPGPHLEGVEGPSGVNPSFFQRVLGNSFSCPGRVHLIYYFDGADGFRQVDRSGAGQLLDVRLPSVKLGELPRWNEPLTLAVLEANPVLRDAEHKLGLTAPPASDEIDMLLTPPGDLRIPHLPSSLAADTVEHDFDKLAKTFSVAVLFGVCEQSHVIGARSTNTSR